MYRFALLSSHLFNFCPVEEISSLARPVTRKSRLAFWNQQSHRMICTAESEQLFHPKMFFKFWKGRICFSVVNRHALTLFKETRCKKAPLVFRYITTDHSDTSSCKPEIVRMAFFFFAKHSHVVVPLKKNSALPPSYFCLYNCTLHISNHPWTPDSMRAVPSNLW